MQNEANTVAPKIAVFQHAIPLELPFKNVMHGVGVRELLTMAASPHTSAPPKTTHFAQDRL